jgi:hypothetical protein
MSLPSSLKTSLIAPCGMNCGRCMAHLREKNHCPGCRFIEPRTDKSTIRRTCVIKRCRKRTGTNCSSCRGLPCRRLKQLDQRYRTNYATGLIDNLRMIKESGIRAFVRREKIEGTCAQCGALLSIHRSECLQCGKSWRSTP